MKDKNKRYQYLANYDEKYNNDKNVTKEELVKLMRERFLVISHY